MGADYVLMNISIAARPRTGASLFCSWLRNSDLYFSGIELESTSGGMLRYTPVRGGERCSSRARWLMTAQKLAPAEVPPTKKPLSAFAFSAETLEAAYRSRL